MIKYRRICDGFVMDIKTGLIEEESNVQYVPFSDPVIGSAATVGQFIIANFGTGTYLSIVSGLGGYGGFSALVSVLSFVGKSLVSGLLAGGGGGAGETGQARDEGVKTRVSPDTSNRLPVVYGDQRMKGTVFMSELSTGNDSSTWITMVAVAEGEIDSFTKVSWGDKDLTLTGDVNTGLRSVTNAKGPAAGDVDDDSYNEGRLKVRGYPRGGRCAEMEAFNGGNNAWVNDGKHVNRRMPFAYFVFILERSADHGVTALGNVNFEVKGRRVRTLNPDGTLTTSKSYSMNPAECLIDYLTSNISGARLPDYRLNLDSFVEFKDFCDEMADYIDLNEVTRQAIRYTCNGVINTNETIDINIEEMLICAQASLSYTLGQFEVIVNREKATTYVFNDDNIVGNVSAADTGFDSVNNEVIMHFNSKKNNWQEDQVDAVTPMSLRNANEPDLSVELPLAFNNNAIEAQRLAHIDLNQWRQNKVITFNTFISALEVQAGDVVDVTHETVGFTNKLFRVIQVEETPSGASNALGLKITALEYSAAVYTINAPHDVDVALNTTLPDPTVGVTISNLQTVSVNVRDSITGLAKVRENISWDCSQPRYVQEYEIDYKLSTDTLWNTTFSTNQSVTISNLESEKLYDIRVRAFIDLGSKSEFLVGTFTAGVLTTLISPTALNISEENVVITEATGAQVRVTATWSKPNVTFPVRYVLEYKLSEDTDYSESISVDETTATILPFETGVYDFRVKAIDVNEVSSGFTTVTDKPIVGLTDIPVDVTNFSIAATSTQALLSWTLATDVDVRTGGHVEIRYHSSTTSSANWSGAQSLISNVPGSATSVSVPLLKGTYLVKFIDSGNRESLNASIVTNSFVPSNFAFVTNLIEDDTFLGTKVDCTVTSGELVLDTGETEMGYTFNNMVDLGSVRSIKVDLDLEVDVQAISSQVCNISTVCFENNFCGVQESASVKLLMSTTDDDTSGTPTWSAYNEFIPGEYTARGFRFKLRINVNDTNTAARVQRLRVEFDAENITQRGSFTSIDGTTTITFPKAFYSGIAGTTKPNIGTQIIGGSQGEEVLIDSVSNTGFVAEVKKNNIAVVGRTVNWQAVGE